MTEKQKTSVVTGTSKGIGEAIAKKLLEEGWEVYGISRTPAKVFAGNSRYHQVLFDLTKTAELEKLVDQLPAKIDLLVNNAGMWELKLLKDITLEHIDKTINLNFKTPLYLTKLLLPKLSTGSTVINISSVMGRYTEPEYGVYAATKAGIDRFTTTLAKEHPELRVVGILPCAVDTPTNRIVCGPETDYSEFLTPEEIAGVVMLAVGGGLASGSLVVVTNNKQAFWEDRDKYASVNVDDQALS